MSKKKKSSLSNMRTFYRLVRRGGRYAFIVVNIEIITPEITLLFFKSVNSVSEALECSLYKHTDGKQFVLIGTLLRTGTIVTFWPN